VGFRRLDYGLLTEVFSSKTVLSSVEISTHLTTLLLGTHVAVAHHRLQHINRRKNISSAPSFKTINHTTNVTTDSSPPIQKRKPMDKISPIPKTYSTLRKLEKKCAHKAILINSNP
jgi:hypothetical protein